jgi:hypothetical protein
MSKAMATHTQPDEEIERLARMTMVTHALIAALLLWVLAFFVPWFSDFLKSFGLLPSKTFAPSKAFIVVTDVSSFVRQWMLSMVGATGGVLWLDGRLYAYLNRRFGGSAALIWFLGLALALIGAVVFSLWTVTSFASLRTPPNLKSSFERSSWSVMPQCLNHPQKPACFLVRNRCWPSRGYMIWQVT